MLSLLESSAFNPSTCNRQMAILRNQSQDLGDEMKRAMIAHLVASSSEDQSVRDAAIGELQRVLAAKIACEASITKLMALSKAYRMKGEGGTVPRSPKVITPRKESAAFLAFKESVVAELVKDHGQQGKGSAADFDLKGFLDKAGATIMDWHDAMQSLSQEGVLAALGYHTYIPCTTPVGAGKAWTSAEVEGMKTRIAQLSGKKVDFLALLAKKEDEQAREQEREKEQATGMPTSC